MAGSRIPAINWSANEGELISKLITELEKIENFKVFLGKKDKYDNTSGDSKAKVAKRMGQAILPELYKIDPKVVGDRVKGKIDALVAEYQKHARRLQKTGDGVNNPDNPNTEESQFWISGQGPDESTPEHAVNIWEEIARAWSFFPRFHALYATRPNVNPIAVSTGVGPHGPKTLWIQRPDYIDPSLAQASVPPSPAPLTPSGSESFGTDFTNFYEAGTSSSSAPTPTPVPTAATPPTASQHAIEKMKANIRVASKKRAFMDEMLDVTKENMQFLRADAAQKRINDQCAMLLSELQAGVWTPEEYKKMVKDLTNPTPAKRQRQDSPEWTEEWPVSSQEI